LEYQIEKLLRAGQGPAADATGEEAGKEDPLSYKPNPDMLVSKLDQMAEVELQFSFLFPNPWNSFFNVHSCRSVLFRT
jgi:hypothetical protein